MSKIKAYFRREERYEGLQLVFKDCLDKRESVLEAIEEAKRVTGANPDIFENSESSSSEPYAYYIEFNDDYDKDGGDFFEIVLKKLNIEKCE